MIARTPARRRRGRGGSEVTIVVSTGRRRGARHQTSIGRFADGGDRASLRAAGSTSCGRTRTTTTRPTTASSRAGARAGGTRVPRGRHRDDRRRVISRSPTPRPPDGAVMRVAVLSGGRSSEHEVSLRSGAAVAEGLAAAGHEVVAVRIERDGRWIAGGDEVELVPAAACSARTSPFPSCTGPTARTGRVQGLLECLDVAYVGAGVLAAAICIDKLDLQAPARLPRHPAGATSAPAARRGGASAAGELGLAAVGEAVAARLERRDHQGRGPRARARRSGRDRARHDPRVIVEAGATGSEVECSVIGNERAARPRCPGEIVAHADWYDYEAKYRAAGWSSSSRRRSTRRRRQRVRELAARVYRVTGCSRLRALRLLRHRGRRGAGQRAQHDPRVHRDERVREAVRGDRDPVSRAVRPSGPTRDRAPRAEREYEF